MYFSALNFCIDLVVEDEDVVTLLSGESVRLSRNSLVSKERFLWKQAQEFTQNLAKMVKEAAPDRQRLIFVTLFKFTPLTKERF